MKVAWFIPEGLVVKRTNIVPRGYVSKEEAFLNTCDIIIFHNRFKGSDVLLAKRLIASGKKIIIDTNFPAWNPYYSLNTSEIISNFYKIVKISSYVIVNTLDLNTDLLSYIKKISIETAVITDEPNSNNTDLYEKIFNKITMGYVEKTIRKENKVLFIGNKPYHVHIRDVRDGWIMQVIGDYLTELNDKDILFTTGKKQDFSADINYYINWTNNEPKLDKLEKTKCDMIMFTHFEPEHIKHEDAIIKWADLYTCMTRHGEQELIKRRVAPEKIGVIEAFGVSTKFRRKITIGWAGRPYELLMRKNLGILVDLAKDLDNTVFNFMVYDTRGESWNIINKMRKNDADVQIIKENYDFFLNSLSYYLSPSKVEGGPMDILNAFYAGVPVVAMDIGFFNTLKTTDGYCFKDYDDLLEFFKKIEQKKKENFKKIEPYTWDTFKRWHIKHFRKVFNI
jgi:glycosyltransferase involved in cell wall biosynthesis